MLSSFFVFKCVQTLEEQQARHNKEITEMFERFTRERQAQFEHNKKEMNECALITFLENYSETNFDMN
jgi:hypothetical protein